MKNYRAVLLLAIIVVAACAPVTNTHRALTPALRSAPLVTPPGYVRGAKDQRASRVIIFVHGVFGDGTSTWTNRSTGVYFPSLVAADDTFAGVDIWVHDFDTPKLRQSYTIDELADHLRKYLNNDNVIANHQEIIFLCHSMGGLVARAYLLKYHREIPPDRVRMMYFYSTPTTGSDIASLARLLSSNPQLADMRKMTTDDAGVLGVWEAQWSSSPYAQNTLSYCAYELLPTMGNMIVQRESARHLCNTRPDPIARNHIEIVKPADNTSDESYIAFREAYRDTYERDRERGAPLWNLRRHERALLEARNVTQTPFCENECSSEGIVVAPGDTVNLAISYANDALITAREARVRLALPPTPAFFATVTATLSALNAQAAHGQVRILALTPVLLVPTAIWRENDDTDERQPLPYTQTPAQVATDGIRLGDIGIASAPARIIVQLQCVPATVVEQNDPAKDDRLFEQLKSGPREDDLAGLLTPIFTGRIENDLPWTSKWVSDVNDVHDDSDVSALLSHFNNTMTAQRDLRASITIVNEQNNAAAIVFTLRDATGVIRTDTARVRYRPGTTQRLRLLAAYPAPKTMIHTLELLKLVMADARADEAEIAPFPLKGTEILLGDVAPQTAVSAEINFTMNSRAVRAEGPARDTTTERTTLNANVEHPLLQVANERHTLEWKTHLAAFRAGDPLAFTFYFKNTGPATARDVHLRLAITNDEQGIKAAGSMVAANATTVSSEVDVIRDGRWAPTRLYFEGAEVYRMNSTIARRIDAADDILLGDLDPDEWGWVKIVYVTADSTDGAACNLLAALPGKRIEFTIAVNNESALPLRDAKLRVKLDHLPQTLRSTISITANDQDLASRTYSATTLREEVRLRFREAQVYTSAVGRHVDARKATEAPVTLGDVPPHGQLFVRLTYDVMRERREGCARDMGCHGKECPGTVPCRF